MKTFTCLAAMAAIACAADDQTYAYQFQGIEDQMYFEPV